MLRVQTYIWAYHFGLLQGNSTSFCSNLDSSSGNGHSCPSLEYLRLFQRQQKAQEMQIVAERRSSVFDIPHKRMLKIWVTRDLKAAQTCGDEKWLDKPGIWQCRSTSDIFEAQCSGCI